jgi:glyoxylase-like metal-dependent hydrolase (beta-lactamase superfamily II)
LNQPTWGLSDFFDNCEARVEYWEGLLSQLEPGTPEALEAAGWAWAHGRFLEEARAGYELVPPQLTFQDHLRLGMGDLTLDLYHVPGLHTEEDLVVYIPEEGVLITGDLFFPGQEIQIPDSALSTVPMALEMLSQFLECDPPLKTVIPGHCCLRDAAWLEGMCRRLGILTYSAFNASAGNRRVAFRAGR